MSEAEEEFKRLLTWLHEQPGGNTLPSAEVVRQRVEARLRGLDDESFLPCFRSISGEQSCSQALYALWGRLAVVLAYSDAYPTGAPPVEVSGKIAEAAEALIIDAGRRLENNP